MRFTKNTSRTLPEFRRRLSKLPPELRKLARIKFEAFLENPQNVDFKRVKLIDSPPVYSARINLSYRALGFIEEEKIFWFWIGPHDEYMRTLKRLAS